MLDEANEDEEDDTIIDKNTGRITYPHSRDKGTTDVLVDIGVADAPAEGGATGVAVTGQRTLELEERIMVALSTAVWVMSFHEFLTLVPQGSTHCQPTRTKSQKSVDESMFQQLASMSQNWKMVCLKKACWQPIYPHLG
jgi:hypothetical protein